MRLASELGKNLLRRYSSPVRLSHFIESKDAGLCMTLTSTTCEKHCTQYIYIYISHASTQLESHKSPVSESHVSHLMHELDAITKWISAITDMHIMCIVSDKCAEYSTHLVLLIIKPLPKVHCLIMVANC